MRYLQALNWALSALGAVMAVNLAVVCLLYYLHLDAAPRYRGELPAVINSMLLFLGMGLTGLAAALGLRGRHAWRWPAEILLLLATAATVFHFLPG